MTRIGLNSLEIKSIEWSTEVIFQTPYLLPTLYEYSKLFAYAIISGPIPSQIVVRTMEGQTIVLEGSSIQMVEGDIIHKLAARSRIRDLEESRSEMQYETNFSKRNLLIKESIIDLAQKYNLMSRETSFIAIDITQYSDPETSTLRQIPLKAPRGNYDPNDATLGSPWSSFMIFIIIVMVLLVW